MNPTRRSILKWGGIALGSSPVIGVLSLAAAGPSLLEKQRSAARREGIPLTPEDLRPNPPIPDSENAGSLLKELTKRYLALPGNERNVWEKLSGDLLKNPTDEALQAQFRASLLRYTELLDLARRASLLPHCDMGYDWSLGPNLLFPEFAVLRQFARAFTALAIIAPDATRAYNLITFAAGLGNLIFETPCIIAALVGVAIHSIADKGYIATLKRFGPSPQARQTLAAFNPPPKPEHYFGGEVILGTMTMKQMREGTLKNLIGGEEEDTSSTWKGLSIAAPVATPIWEKQLLIFWRQAFPKIREVERTGNYHELGEWLDRLGKSWERDRLNVPQNLIVLILFPVFSQATTKTHIQTQAQRLLRETALALLEEKAKTGVFPDSPVLPADPFSRDKEPLRYRKDSNGCVLYSVGQDHTDDGGMEKREKSSEKLDMVVRL